MRLRTLSRSLLTAVFSMAPIACSQYDENAFRQLGQDAKTFVHNESAAETDGIISAANLVTERPKTSLAPTSLTITIDLYPIVQDYQNQRPCATGESASQCATARRSIVFPLENYLNILEKAYRSGFSRIYFRVSNIGTMAIKLPDTGNPDLNYEVADVLQSTVAAYDPLQETLLFAKKKSGLEVFAWVTPFDNASTPKCTNTDGNQSCTKHAYQSHFSFAHPELQLLRPQGDTIEPLWGIFSFSEPAVRTHFATVYLSIAENYPELSGLFLCDRTHSNDSLLNGKQYYGYNPVVVSAYTAANNQVPPTADNLNVELFSKIQGQFYTQFLEQLSDELRSRGKKLHVKASWDNMGSLGRRHGHLHKSFFEPALWLRDKIVDKLIIGCDGGTIDNTPEPECSINSYDTTSETNSPRLFSSDPDKVDRWLTLWSWGLRQATSPNEVQGVMFKEAVIAKAIQKYRGSGVGGMILHEAYLIDRYHEWNTFKDTPLTVGSLHLLIHDAYLEVRGVRAGPAEMAVHLPNFKAGSTKEKLIASLKAGQRTLRDRDLLTIIDRAYLAVRGTVADSFARSYWQQKIRQQGFTYQEIVHELTSKLGRLSPTVLRAIASRAHHAARGAAANNAAITAADIEIVAIGGYAALHGQLVAEHLQWKDQQLDALAISAYRVGQNITPANAHLAYWRAALRRGEVDYAGLVRILAAAH